MLTSRCLLFRLRNTKVYFKNIVFILEIIDTQPDSTVLAIVHLSHYSASTVSVEVLRK